MNFALTRRRVLVALIAIVMLVILGLSIFRPRSANVTLEQAPCTKCRAVYSASEIPTIAICELTDNLTRYDGKLVRLKAIFVHDAGQTYLRPEDGTCLQGGGGMNTGLDERSEACDGARKALSVYTGFETWYDSRAKVVVIGRVGQINNPRSYFHKGEGFNILCLEHVEPIGSGEAERRKYESWRGWLLQPPQ
jgi:hypothetical protein